MVSGGAGGSGVKDQTGRTHEEPAASYWPLARLGASPERPGPRLSASRVSHHRPAPLAAERELRIQARTPLLLRGDFEACRAACPGAPWLALLVRSGVRRLDRLMRAFGPPG